MTRPLTEEQFDREDIEAVADCLGDDAAQLRQDNDEDERADNMDRAASMLTWMLLTHPAFTKEGVTAAPALEVQQSLETLATALRMQRNNVGTTEEEDTMFHLALITVQRACGVLVRQASSDEEAARQAFEQDAKTRDRAAYADVPLKDTRTEHGYINPSWHADWLLWKRAWDAASGAGIPQRGQEDGNAQR